MKKLVLAGIVVLFGSVAFAQVTPKAEVSINYSYIRTCGLTRRTATLPLSPNLQKGKV
jgi:hypothetical protein